MRTFAVERIEKIEVRDETFEMPADFSVSEYARGAFGIAGGKPEAVEIAFEAAVADVVDVGEKFIRGETYGMNRQAILDEPLLEPHSLGHGGTQIFPEVFCPDIRIFVDELDEKFAKEFNVV